MASSGSRSDGAAGSGGTKKPAGAATRRRSRPTPPAQNDTPAVEPGDDISVESTGDPVAAAGVDPETLLQANDEDLKKLEEARRAKLIKVGILGVVTVLLITFVIQNAKPVPVRLVFFTQTMRLIWLIVVAAALGGIGGYLIGKPDKHVRLHGPRRRREDAPPV